MMTASSEKSYQLSLPTEEATIAFGKRLSALLVPGDLLVLSGDLGAGKTFLTEAIVRSRGLPEEEYVTSPTYTLVNEYELEPTLLHADLYRLASEDEAFELGLEPARRKGAILICEWGLKYLPELGPEPIVVEMEPEPRSLQLKISGHRPLEETHYQCGARQRAIIDALAAH